jgi:hypothetical protein
MKVTGTGCGREDIAKRRGWVNVRELVNNCDERLEGINADSPEGDEEVV